MKLSIIVPAYNCEAYIESCIQMIINEIDNNIELIIIDDGSKDNTLKLSKKYESSNVHIYHQENQGVSMARNKGIEIATGEYIMFVDSDDTLVSGWSNKVVHNIPHDCDIIYYGECYNEINYSKDDIIKSIFGVPCTHKAQYMASACSKVFRRKLIIDNHIKFKKGIINGEDLLFSLECFLCSNNYKFINTPIYNYYINYNSATHTFKDSFLKSNKDFLTEAEIILMRYNIKDNLREECIKFSFINSVILLLIRISYITDKELRKQKIALLNEPYIYKGIKKYKMNIKEYGLSIFLLYTLISCKCYNLALKAIQIKLKKGNTSTSKYNTI